MTEPTTLDLTATKLPVSIVDHANSLVGAAQRAVIQNDTDLANSASLVAQVNAHIDAVDEGKDRIGKPLWAAWQALLKEWHTSRDPLVAAKTLVIGKQNAYYAKREAEREAEEKRLREEAEAKALEEAAAREAEAKQLAEKATEAQKAGDTEAAAEFTEAAQEATAEAAEVLEEAAHAPVNLPPPPAIARGAYGSVGTKSVWVGRNTDPAKVFAQIGGNEKVMEALQKVVDGMVRGGTRKMAGVEIKETKQANNRR